MNKDQEMGANGTCETIKVKADNEQGYALINAHDFDAKVHEKFEPKAPAKKDK